MEGKSKQVFLIMKDRKYRYCLYRVSPPETETSEEEATVKNLDEPLLRMDEAKFPDQMSFKAIGSRLFMVGGFGRLKEGDCCTKFNKVFIYDIGSSTLSSGPSLVSGKSNPILFTFGSRLFALSRMIHCNWNNDALDSIPRFEVLDTDLLDHGWSSLPLPNFPATKFRKQLFYNVEASVAICVGSKEVIFISVSEAGTYAFDVDTKVWHQVSKEIILPFHGHANTFPDVGSLCFGYSSKSKRLSVFRFHYYVADENDENSIEFQVFESEVETPTDLSPPHSPVLYHYGRSITILGSSGKVYSLKGGVDTVGARNTFIGNRYVRVAGFVLSVAANKAKKWSLKRCEKKRKKMERMGSSSEQHDETMELRLTLSWQDVFFGGPMCDVQHVTAAFVA